MFAQAELEPNQIQDFSDIIPKILEIKAKSNIPLKFTLKVEVGDGEVKPDSAIIDKLNVMFKDISDGLELR